MDESAGPFDVQRLPPGSWVSDAIMAQHLGQDITDLAPLITLRLKSEVLALQRAAMSGDGRARTRKVRAYAYERKMVNDKPGWQRRT